MTEVLCTVLRMATRTGLSQEVIVDRAIGLAEREGLSALSMRRLGQELGVDGTAFYRYFRDKDDLVLAVGDRVTRWTLDRVRETVAADAPWQDVLRGVARAAWAASTKYPAVFAMTFSRTTGQEAERAMVELLLGSVAKAGLSARQTVLTYRSFADTTLALCGMNASVGAMDERVREKDRTAWSRIYAVLPNETYPLTRRHTDELVGARDEEIFLHTVEAIIAAAEAAARAGS
jgi:AcrR family transcriptional regulator